jgi:3-(3-hydroxy-phenyl)propionate hydroxylase
VLPECPVRVHHEGAVRDDHLTSLLGPRFTVFYFSDDGSVPAALQRTCTDLAREAPLALRIVSRVAAISAATPILEDHTGRLFPMYGATPGTVYVVRPDGHVLARWREGTPAALAAAVRRCLMRPVAANAEALSA